MENNIVLDGGLYKIRHSLKGNCFILTYFDKLEKEESTLYRAYWKDTESIKELIQTFNDWVYGNLRIDKKGKDSNYQQYIKEKRAETKVTLQNYIQSHSKSKVE